MKILVTSFSKTGNTRKVAEAIYKALDEEDKEMKSMNEAEFLMDYALIFCGFPVHLHSVPVAAQNFPKKIHPGTKVALFSTHTGPCQKDKWLRRPSITQSGSSSRTLLAFSPAGARLKRP